MAINFLSYRFIKCVRTVFYTGLLFFVTTTVYAGTQTIHDIEVDITADNAVKAREEAFEAAQIKGYKTLATELLSEDEITNFEMPDINTIARYVKDFEVTNEKLSATRYKGTYTIRYDTSAFEGVAPASNNNTVSKILVLPFFKNGAQSYLWQLNPFMDAFVSERVNSQSKNIIIPIGTIEDVQQIRDHQAFTPNFNMLENMRTRYSATHIAIIIAQPHIQPNGQKKLNISLHTPTTNDKIRAIKQTSLNAYPGENQRLFYTRAVGETLKMLEATNRNLTLEHAQPLQQANQPTTHYSQVITGNSQKIKAQLNFQSMREWVQMKQKMEQSRTISNISIKTLSPRFALLNIDYYGSKDALKITLNEAGIDFIDSATFLAVNTAENEQHIHQLHAIAAQQSF